LAQAATPYILPLCQPSGELFGMAPGSQWGAAHIGGSIVAAEGVDAWSMQCLASAPAQRRRPSAGASTAAASFASSLPRWVPRPAIRRGLLLALAASLAAPVRAAYFLVEDGKERCFTENILNHQVLRMRYSMRDTVVLVDRDIKKSQCRIFVRNPSGKVVMEHVLLERNVQDALAFLAQAEGEHKICLICDSEDWFGLQRKETKWSIAFDVIGAGGIGDADPARLASLAHLKGTQALVEVALSRVQALSSENEYEQAAEARFVRTSEAVNFDVRAFKVLQVMLILFVTAFQLQNLARFLRKNAMGCMGCLPFRNVPIL